MWQYNITSGAWKHLSGSKVGNIPINSIIPYPGGMMEQTMVIDSTDTNIYVFGGVIDLGTLVFDLTGRSV